MRRFGLAIPGVATSYAIDDEAIYVLGTSGSRNQLVTTEYYESGVEPHELRSFKPSFWGVDVPDGAELFAPTGGITPENARQYWVGWLLGQRVSMLALMQKHPVEADLAADETALFPPVMDKAGVAALYSWRPVAQGVALWRRLFTGAVKTKPSVTTEALTEIPGRPVVSVVGAIPGEPTQHAIIGWAEDTAAGAVLGIAVVRPDQIRVMRSDPIPGFIPFVHQRPGIWASAPPTAERYELKLALESREEPHRYQTAQLSVAAQSGERMTSLQADLPTGQLHAAAYDYAKDHVGAFANQEFLTKDGRLWSGPPFRLTKQGVSLDDPLTILMTYTQAYWGERSADGGLSFHIL